MRVLGHPGHKSLPTAMLALLAAALVLMLGGVPDRGRARQWAQFVPSAGNWAALVGLALPGGASSTRRLNTPATVTGPAQGGPLSFLNSVTAPLDIVPQSPPAAVNSPAITAIEPLIGTTTDDGINVRSGPGPDFRILVQLPANTRASILAEQPGWYHIRTLSQTDGWVASDYLKVSPEQAGDTLLQSLGSAGVVGAVNLRAGPGTGFPTLEQLTDGSALEVLALQGDWYKVRSPLGTIGWVAADYAPLDWIPDIYGGSSPPSGAASSDVVHIAQKYLGARYIWGGSDPDGFDCSGLVWYVYDQVGVWLPAGSAQQFSTDYGRYIDSISALAPGDLVFFERTTEEAGITHVGIYAGDGKMIAARSERLGVRYVSLSDPFWSSRFVGGIRPYR